MTLILALLACDTDGDEKATDFEGGNFVVTTTAVDDTCTDGAFATIFMPTGAAEVWDNPVELPGAADLPKTYTIQVQDPYGDVEITVSAGTGEDELDILGDEQADIPVENYDGCLVNQAISGTLTVVDADDLQGSIVMTTTSMDEPECPAQKDSCTVTLDISAARQ